MIARDIYDEIRQATGHSNEALNLKILTRAIKLLSNSGLFDPLVGVINIVVSQGHTVVMPRDVKTVLKINIDNTPSFFRDRAFEFALNTNGTESGDGVGWSWSDRGFVPVQIPGFAHGRLAYKTSSTADNGKTITAYGIDANGRDITETLVGLNTSPEKGSLEFYGVTRVTRQETSLPATLTVGDAYTVIGQYYADETSPNYRAVRLSKTGVTARVLYIRHVFKISSQDDFIPLSNEEAVVHACKAVKLRMGDEYEKASVVEAAAIKMLQDEQATLNRAIEVAQADKGGATDYGINMRDSVVAGDVYDVACEIFGRIGRRKILDKITSAIECLRNEAYWDAEMGVVDVFTTDRSQVVGSLGGLGSGYFVLPRYVETVVSLIDAGNPSIPRNGWFEFHLNGSWERDVSNYGAWDHAGEVCIIRDLDREIRTGVLTGTTLLAIPDSAEDNGTPVRIFGREKLQDGSEVEVWRAGVRGWLSPCVHGSVNPGSNPPKFTHVENITKGESSGFIRLVSLVVTQDEIEEFALDGYTSIAGGATISLSSIEWAAGVSEMGVIVYRDHAGAAYAQFGPLSDPGVVTQIVSSTPVSVEIEGVATVAISSINISALPVPAEGLTSATTFKVTKAHSEIADTYGNWYPDELTPRYLRIKVSSYETKRIRILYRKRTSKIDSLYDPIHLRSRVAIECMLRALKVMETDPVGAMSIQAVAVAQLNKEKINWSPNDTAMLQFDSSCMAGNSDNIS